MLAEAVMHDNEHDDARTSLERRPVRRNPQKKIIYFFKKKDFYQFIVNALPFIGSTIIDSGHNFMSAYLLSVVGKDELAASGFITSALCFQQGFLFYPEYAVGIMSGDVYGQYEKRKLESEAPNIELNEMEIEGLNAVIQQGYAFGVILSVPMILISCYAGTIASGLDQDQPDQKERLVSQISSEFFGNYAWGCWADILLIATQQHATAIGMQSQVLVSSALQKALTQTLNYGWLFGKLGMQKLGVSGMGYAYSIGAITNFIGLNLYLSNKGKIKLLDILSLSNLKRRFNTLKNLIEIGLPISIHIGSELIHISALIVMCGTRNSKQLISAEVVMEYTGLFLVPIMGASQAVAILVSQANGANDYELARRYANTGYVVGAVLPLVSSVLMFVLYRNFVDVFVSQQNTEYESIIDISKKLMFVNGIIMLPDFIRNLSIGALRGIFDTKVPMYLNLTTAAIGTGLAAISNYAFSLDSEYSFSARAVCITAAGIILTIRWSNLIKEKIRLTANDLEAKSNPSPSALTAAHDPTTPASTGATASTSNPSWWSRQTLFGNRAKKNNGYSTFLDENKIEPRSWCNIS